MLQQALPDVEVRHAGLSNVAVLPQSSTERTLFITVGNAAAQRAAESGIPTLNTLITRRSFELQKGGYKGPVSAIYLEQPLARHLMLIRSALPGRDKLTVLLGSESQQQRSDLEAESRRLGLILRLITVTEDSAIDKLFGSELLAEDTLLLLPDPTVVNRHTVKPLVLGSYRQGVPLVGYSQALVKAGALMAVHSSLPVLESELRSAAEAFFKRGALIEPRHAEDFDVSVNYQLARALDISLPAENLIKKTLRGRLP